MKTGTSWWATGWWIAAAALFGGAVSGAWAQRNDTAPADNLLQQQLRIDRELEERRAREAPLDSLLDWQWGGWVEYYWFHFDDGVQESRTLHRPGVSLWTRLTIDQGAHEIYARTKLTYEYFHDGDEFDRQEDWEGPNLERGWYRVDVGRALRLTDPGDPYQFEVQLGRQEVVYGTGYTLDLPLDAVTFTATLDDFRIRGLFGKSVPSYPNIDRSEPVDSHSARRFYGLEVAYEGFSQHEPFFFAVWNDDFTDERPQDWFQNYTYDSRYFGLGSRGSLASDLNYWTEWVYETGESYGDGHFIVRDPVRAWAFDVGIEYFFQVPTRPRVDFEYMFASGDGDRRGSPTNAAGGNRRGDDTSFVGFGYRDTGISAAPALSNMHVWRAGASFLPLEDVDFFRELELGTNWFLYHKHQRAGAISDPTATEDSGYVGWEMDYYANWRIKTDLSWTVRWGAFFPGDAYNDKGARHFIFTGVTWTF